MFFVLFITHIGRAILFHMDRGLCLFVSCITHIRRTIFFDHCCTGSYRGSSCCLRFHLCGSGCCRCRLCFCCYSSGCFTSGRHGYNRCCLFGGRFFNHLHFRG